MTVAPDPPGDRLEFPPNWDVIRDGSPDDPPRASNGPSDTPPDAPPVLSLLAASWADAVSVLTVCTSALLGLAAMGHGGLIAALPWAAVLGVAWWTAAAAILVLVRQGTPGMLIAGLVFNDAVPPGRVPLAVAAAGLHVILAGLPGLLGPRRSPLALAAGGRLEVTAAG